MNKRSPLEDRLYQQFYDTEADVPQDMWKNIEAHLNVKEEKKRPFPTFYFLTILAVSVFGTLAVFNAHFTAKGQRSDDVMPKTVFPIESEPLRNQTAQKGLPPTPAADARRAASPGPVSRNNKETALPAGKDTKYADSHDQGQLSLVFPTSGIKEAEPTMMMEGHNDPAGIISGQATLPVPNEAPSVVVHQTLPPIGQPDIGRLSGTASRSIALPAPVLYRDRTNAFFLQISAGAGLPLRKLRYTPAENRAYSARQSTEKPLYAWNINAGLGFLLDNRWSFSSGFEYFTLKEKFNYYKENAGRLQYRYDENGQPIDTQLIKGVMIERSGNTYQLINIPLSIGYETRAGKWKLGIEAGLAFNVSLSPSGKILTNDQQVQRLENTEDIYLSRTGISWRAGLQCLRSVDRTTAVFIRPQYQHYPERWTRSGHPADIRYSFLQCNVGLRKAF